MTVLPTLFVLCYSLLQSGRSFRAMSESRLLETAGIIAQSTASELATTQRFLASYVENSRPGGSAIYSLQTALVAGSDDLIFRIPEGVDPAVLTMADVPPPVAELVARAFQTGAPQVSNILEGQVSGQEVSLVIAMPFAASGGLRQVTALVARPEALFQSLLRDPDPSQQVVLAIIDGHGRVIGRSVDEATVIGGPTPAWSGLQSMADESGSFRGTTSDGSEIVFSFQEVPGTPGWMAVAGEPSVTFDARWQEPIQNLVVMASLTLMVGLCLTAFLLRRILQPIAALARRARQVAGQGVLPVQGDGRAGPPSVPGALIAPSFITEVETLRLAITSAEAALQARLADSQLAAQTASRSLAGLEQAERLARMGSWTFDTATGRFILSRMLRELAELPPEVDSLSIEDLRLFFAVQDYDRLIAFLEACIAHGTPYSYEARAMLPSGNHFMAWVRGDALLDADGKVIGVTGTVQDIEEQTEQVARLSALADNLPSGLILRLERDEARHLSITYLSGGVEGLTGHPASHILDTPGLLAATIATEHRTELIRLLRDADGSGTVLDRQFPIRGPEGQEIWVRGRAALRVLDGGRAIWDGIILDISTERVAVEALRAAKTAAETAERAKSDFLATMSHEIRTPMNAVIGMTRLALRTDLSPRQKRYLERIDDSANVLLGIINDILDFSKIEAGALSLEDVPFRLEAVLETVASINAIRAEEKGLELTFNVAPEVPAHLSGDALRLGQVLTNLVGNAVKFTDAGDVVVHIQPEETQHSGRVRLVFSVEDSGIGIPPDRLSSLFKPFTQADVDTARRYGGTGLGLAISRQIVAMMRGGIQVESALGEGSTFTFTAEFGEVSAEHGAGIEAVSQRLRLTGRRVLVVDDSTVARMALCDMIQGFGAEVQSAATGAEALTLLQGGEGAGEPYDILLLDWRMPEMDGIALARCIRQDERLLHVPAILMVTAYGHDLALKDVQPLGFREILVKPVTPSQIYNALIETLSAVPPIESEPSSEWGGGLDLAPIRARLAGRSVLVVDDNPLNREVATEFLGLVGIDTHEAANGREAIDRLRETAFDAVLMDVHMPVMNGLEAIREIRSRPEWARLPVIALTAQARREDTAASRIAGMSDHLTKPINEAALYRSLITLIGDQNQGDDLPAVPSQSHAVGHPPGPAGLFTHFRERPERLAQFIDGFLRDFGQMDQQLSDLVARGHFPDVADHAHRVLGTVGYLGDDRLQSACAALETAARAERGGDVVALGPKVAALMRDCLDRLRQMRSDLPDKPPVTPDELPIQEALRLVRDALPLVERGDFAAGKLLERLANGLTGTQQVQACHICDLFDELEIHSAYENLERLLWALQAAGKEDAA